MGIQEAYPNTSGEPDLSPCRSITGEPMEIRNRFLVWIIESLWFWQVNRDPGSVPGNLLKLDVPRRSVKIVDESSGNPIIIGVFRVSVWVWRLPIGYAMDVQAEERLFMSPIDDNWNRLLQDRRSDLDPEVQQIPLIKRRNPLSLSRILIL
jgi:hypothetical protein